MATQTAKIERADADYWRGVARQENGQASAARAEASVHESKAKAEDAQPSKRRSASLGT